MKAAMKITFCKSPPPLFFVVLYFFTTLIALIISWNIYAQRGTGVLGIFLK
jgi:hypothetical protein